MENKILKRTDAFYCIHIYDYNKSFDGFTATNADCGFLVDYLIKDYARHDESSKTARTYIILDNETEEIVAYFSLKAGFVSVNENKFLFKRRFDTIPAIELANFAVNGSYITNHPEAKGVGVYVLNEFILPIVQEVSNIIGVKFLYIFALPHKKLIEHYNVIGFSRLPLTMERLTHQRIKPRYDRGCIFMYMPL